MSSAIYHGDCVEVMRTIDSCSIDSIVCDPPYGLSDHTEKDIRACMAAWLVGEEYRHGKSGFMNRNWDSFVPGPEVWKEVFRVLKPGGYVLAFASTRTDDLMSMALRLAGFRKHPFIGWCFGSGFPKAASLSKAFDKQAGVEREVVGDNPNRKGRMPEGYSDGWDRPWQSNPDSLAHKVTAPATEAAKQWDGWAYGLQALKPAIEPCLMFQKPHEGRMTENVLTHGTGALNIDGCRVEAVDGTSTARKPSPNANSNTFAQDSHTKEMLRGGMGSSIGRWPANLILEDCDEVRALFPVTASGAMKSSTNRAAQDEPGSVCYGTYGGKATGKDIAASSGSAARFFHQFSHDEDDVITGQRLFYCGKASKRDRDEGLEHMEAVHRPNGNKWTDTDYRVLNGDRNEGREAGPRKNIHPTVKPTDLMRYLCRLVTPPGGVVLDPFMGSGSTGKAAILEGFSFVGIEREAEYVEIALARIQQAKKQTPQPKQNELFPEVVQ